MTDTPNIYKFATSELSQDATLAYILSWANLPYRRSHPTLNRLGENLLRALVEAASKAKGLENPLDNRAINALDVGTQRDNIDVWVQINNCLFLVIEDKTDTMQHGDQIARYTQAADKYQNQEGKPLQVVAVYVKTGNESKGTLPGGDLCGTFLRHDLLAVFEAIPDTGNTIVEDFRTHLQRWEDDTESYRSTPCSSWSWRARQGYYLELERWLCERRQQSAKGSGDVGWGYVPNRSGGFLGFWWHWRSFARRRCNLYLQIENATRLQIRVSHVIDDAGEKIKSDRNLLWNVYHAIRTASEEEPFDSMQTTKAGDFKGGWYAGVVDITFQDDQNTYLAADSQGIVDLAATQERLLQAMRFVDAVCDDVKEVDA